MISISDIQMAQRALREKSAVAVVARMLAGDVHLVKSYFIKSDESGIVTTDGVRAKCEYVRELVLCSSVQDAQAQLLKK